MSLIPIPLPIVAAHERISCTGGRLRLSEISRLSLPPGVTEPLP